MLLALILLLTTHDLPGPITGDFDHDGRHDVAFIEREGRDVYFLGVKRGGAPDSPLRVSLGNGYPDKLELATAKAHEATACAKGLGPANRPCGPAKVMVEKGDLLLTHSEASQAVMKWDGRSFRLEWISD